MATNELKEVLVKDGRLEIPKEYVDVRPLKIKSHWIRDMFSSLAYIQDRALPDYT